MINHYLGVVVITVASIILSGCGRFDVYSPGQIHRTVQYQGQGIYVVDYKWPYVEKTFGKDRSTAVPAYLEAKKLIPAKCTHGVSVVRGGETQGGGGWAEFRCKELKAIKGVRVNASKLSTKLFIIRHFYKPGNGCHS